MISDERWQMMSQKLLWLLNLARLPMVASLLYSKHHNSKLRF